MPRGLNKLMIIGNLGRDPESKFLQDGTQVTTFSVAVSEKRGGQETTEWFRCVAWRKLAEVANEYLHKGSKVYLEGRLQTRKWQDATTKQEKSAVEVQVDELVLLDSRGGDTEERGAVRPVQHIEGFTGLQMPDASPDDLPF